MWHGPRSTDDQLFKSFNKEWFQYLELFPYLRTSVTSELGYLYMILCNRRHFVIWALFNNPLQGSITES